MDPVAAGVIGVGSLGFHHARLLRDIPEARLVGIYDTDGERAASVADELGVVAYSSLDALLSEIDAVTIAVPTSDHFDVARSALEHDCHLLIEKPITPTVAEADELIELALKRHRIIQVGHIERFNGAVRACEPYLDDPLFVESHRLAPFVPRGTDVPVVLDLMIHDIDLILSLVDRPVSDARAAGVSVISGSVDIANARLEFEGGAVANITASRVSIGRQRKIRFFQPSGYLSLDLGNGTGEFYRRKEGSGAPGAVTQLGELVEHISLRSDGQEPLRLELEAFVSAAAGAAPVAVSGEEGRAALAVALDIVDRIARHTKHVLDTNPT